MQSVYSVPIGRETTMESMCVCVCVCVIPAIERPGQMNTPLEVGSFLVHTETDSPFLTILVHILTEQVNITISHCL